MKFWFDGIVVCVPSKVQRMTEMGLPQDYVARAQKVVGLDQRRVVENEFAVDLGKIAAGRLLEQLHTKRGMIDTVIFVTQTPNYFQPNNAHLLQAALGLSKETACFDINIGCSGWIYGLWVAVKVMRKRALLVCGDTMTRCTNPEDQATAVLFGDGVSATLVSRDGGCDSWAEAEFAFLSRGEWARDIVVGAYDKSAAPTLTMQGGDVLRHAVMAIPEALELMFKTLQTSESWSYGFTKEFFHKYYFHQANNYIVRSAAVQANIPMDRVYLGTLSRFGNLSSASIPCSLCEDKPQNKPIMLCGFGVGFSVAVCALYMFGHRCHYEVIDAEGRVLS